MTTEETVKSWIFDNLQTISKVWDGFAWHSEDSFIRAMLDAGLKEYMSIKEQDDLILMFEDKQEAD